MPDSRNKQKVDLINALKTICPGPDFAQYVLSIFIAILTIANMPPWQACPGPFGYILHLVLSSGMLICYSVARSRCTVPEGHYYIGKARVEMQTVLCL